MTWYHWIVARWLSQPAWCHQESGARGANKDRNSFWYWLSKKKKKVTFLLFQFHLNVISLCFAMITLEEQPVLLLVNVTEQEFVIQGERGHVFLFQTVNICWFGRLSGLHLCSLNTAWDKLPARIILLFIWRPCKQVKAATEHLTNHRYLQTSLFILAKFKHLSGLIAVDLDQLCAGRGGWLLIDEWKQLWAFSPSQSGCYNTLFGRLKRGVAWNTPQTSSKHTIDQKFSVVISSWGWWSSFYNRVSFIVLTKPLDIQDPLNTFKCLPFISLMTLKVVKVVWAGSHVFFCQYHQMFMFILQFYVVTMQCWCLFRSGHWKRSCLGFPVLLPVAEKGLNCGLLIGRTT